MNNQYPHSMLVLVRICSFTLHFSAGTEVTEANCLPICPTVGASCGAQDSRPWAVWQVMAGPHHMKCFYWLRRQWLFEWHCMKGWVSSGLKCLLLPPFVQFIVWRLQRHAKTELLVKMGKAVGHSPPHSGYSEWELTFLHLNVPSSFQAYKTL